ncbi:MAG TPA: hypothetical protein VFH48_14700 [Chloroflexota bacterium]|nr:hypothetical protein [Chloroflexota bacterium]
MPRQRPPEGKVLNVLLDDETVERLQERARREEREVAAQARFFIKRGLEDTSRHPGPAQ